MSRTRSARSAQSLLLAGLLLLALSATVLAKPPAKVSSVKVKGPSLVKIGTKFKFTVSGFAAPPANFLGLFESSGKVGCPKTYNTAFGNVPFIGGKHLTPGKTFSVDVNFKAQHAGKHSLCAYVINDPKTKTYAHGGASWVTHT